MLPQIIPQGPDQRDTAAIIDRTMTFDPADQWRDPLSCPDWPIIGALNVQHTTRVGGRKPAEKRLEQIGATLNRGAGALRPPTADEREAIVASTFRLGITHQPDWYDLGFVMNPLRPSIEREAHLIVEACHLRGYLRKLDALADREAKATEDQKHRDARQTLANYRSVVPPMIEELNGLAEASARHQQRIDDEKAFHRANGLRQSVIDQHRHAVAAAHTLGLGAPDAPQIGD